MVYDSKTLLFLLSIYIYLVDLEILFFIHFLKLILIIFVVLLWYTLKYILYTT